MADSFTPGMQAGIAGSMAKNPAPPKPTLPSAAEVRAFEERIGERLPPGSHSMRTASSTRRGG